MAQNNNLDHQFIINFEYDTPMHYVRKEKLWWASNWWRKDPALKLQREPTLSFGSYLYVHRKAHTFPMAGDFAVACVAGGFSGWLTGKPGTRAKMSGEAVGKWGKGNKKLPARIQGIFE